jgi:hypothetical protein
MPATPTVSLHNKKERHVAQRPMRMPAKKIENDAEEGNEKILSQRRRSEPGRYLLQVDRQTKCSFQTSESAQSAALGIKEGFPLLQVSVYDSITNLRILVELPAPSMRGA